MARDLLSDKFVRSVKRPGLYRDGKGLYLQVSPAKNDALAKSWLFRFWLPETVISATGKERQRERRMGLGSLEDVGLSEAREAASEARKLVRDGRDPIAERDAQQDAKRRAREREKTFDECRDEYVKAHRDEWTSAKVARQWVQALEDHISPVLGRVLVKNIDEALVLKALKPIWDTNPVTATRLRERIENILDYAGAPARKYRTGENPARWEGNLEYELPELAKVHKVKPMPALPYRDAGAFMADLRTRDDAGTPALEFLILTTTRSNEVIGARWSELSKDADTGLDIWTVPPERTKRKKEHRVPLSPAALALLARMPRDGEFIFPGRDGGTLGHNALWQLMVAMARLSTTPGKFATPHGFRSTFRDWAAERTNFPNHVIEMALAHAIENAVEAAYRRGDLLRKRAELMAAWAGYCGRVDSKAGDVVPIRAAS